MQTAVIKKSMGIVLAGLMLATASFEGQAFTIRGARSCGQWVEARKGGYNPAESWLVGFLSGAALGANVDILKGTDNLSLFLWVDNYCRANPLKDLDDAGVDLFLELKKTKRL